jgi:hypothetical protein
MRHVLWLRIAYWAGIIVDAIAAIQMLFPQLLLRTFDIDLVATAEFIFAMRYGAPLMIGWTVLLFWADRKPVERKDILLITAFPVVVGYVVIVIYAIAAGFATVRQMIPALVMQAVLLALFTIGYLKARHLCIDKAATRKIKESMNQ